MNCTDFCMAVQNDCRELCADSTTCSNDCDEVMVDCLIHCPCRSECPDGCNGCTVVFCQCHDGEESSQYLECKVNLYRFTCLEEILLPRITMISCTTCVFSPVRPVISHVMATVFGSTLTIWSCVHVNQVARMDVRVKFMNAQRQQPIIAR